MPGTTMDRFSTDRLPFKDSCCKYDFSIEFQDMSPKVGVGCEQDKR